MKISTILLCILMALIGIGIIAMFFSKLNIVYAAGAAAFLLSFWAEREARKGN